MAEALSQYLSAPSFGHVGGRAVFMDLEADLYFTASGDEEQALISSAAGQAAARPVSASIFDRRAPRAISMRDVFTILLELARVRRSLRSRRLADIVADLAGAPEEIETGAADAPPLARRFAAARNAVPVPRSCLADSLALIGWLGRRGIPSTLVFGVKLDPFAAHCWVQSGSLLLSDRIEEIERFTAVRAIPCAPAMR